MIASTNNSNNNFRYIVFQHAITVLAHHSIPSTRLETGVGGVLGWLFPGLPWESSTAHSGLIFHWFASVVPLCEHLLHGCLTNSLPFLCGNSSHFFLKWDQWSFYNI